MKPCNEGLKLEGFSEVSVAAAAVELVLQDETWEDGARRRLGDIATLLCARQSDLELFLAYQAKLMPNDMSDVKDVVMLFPFRGHARVVRSCLNIAAEEHPDVLVQRAAQGMIVDYDKAAVRAIATAAFVEGYGPLREQA